MGDVSMTRDMDVLLSLEKISKKFMDTDQSISVLNSFSLDIRKGEFISILGPSGCGKSTLLKICSSMILQDSGTVSISGSAVSRPDRNRILMLQDDNQLFPWLTVEKNIAFSIEKSAFMQNVSVITDLLKMAGLSDYSQFYPYQLSGGMKKRTALIRALAGNPEILLMDEPFGSLDAKIKIKLQKFLIDIWKKYNMTILFVTHDIHEAIHLGERILVMNESGQIICDEKIPLQENKALSEDNCFDLYRKYYTLLTDPGIS
jgi:sulfonate transport system ATP-binding protein